MTTLVRLGMLVPPFRSGTSQDRHAPAGRADTPVTRLGRTSSYQVTQARPAACTSPGPFGQADSSRDDTTVRAVQGQTCPAGPAPSSGTTAIFTGGSPLPPRHWLTDGSMVIH